MRKKERTYRLAGATPQWYKLKINAMGNKACVKYAPCKESSSEHHNRREKELSYIVKEDTSLNENWEEFSIATVRANIAERYFKVVRQKMQAKAVPIREASVNIKETTTMDDLRRLAEKFEERWGIHTFQIHVHRDEGWTREGRWVRDERGSIKKNLHAHFVTDWTNSGGKAIKLTPEDMAAMQTLAAEVLGQERGIVGAKKGLNIKEYKLVKADDELIQKEGEKRVLTAKCEKLEIMRLDLDDVNVELEKMNKKLHKEVNKNVDELQEATALRHFLKLSTDAANEAAKRGMYLAFEEDKFKMKKAPAIEENQVLKEAKKTVWRAVTPKITHSQSKSSVTL